PSPWIRSSMAAPSRSGPTPSRMASALRRVEKTLRRTRRRSARSRSRARPGEPSSSRKPAALTSSRPATERSSSRETVSSVSRMNSSALCVSTTWPPIGALALLLADRHRLAPYEGQGLHGRRRAGAGAVLQVGGPERGAAGPDAPLGGRHGVERRVEDLDEPVLVGLDPENAAHGPGAGGRLHPDRKDDHVHRHLHRPAHRRVLAPDEQLVALLEDFGDDALHVLDVVLLLGRPVDLVLPVAVHPHVDVEDEHLAAGQLLADLDGLLGGHAAADLGAVLVADLAVAAADALHEADPLRRQARRRPD